METKTKNALNDLGNYLIIISKKEDITKEDVSNIINKTFIIFKDKNIKKLLPMLNNFNLMIAKKILLSKVR